MDGHLKGRVSPGEVAGYPMHENTSLTRRRWQRQSSKIPISLMLEYNPSMADDSAFTVDISPLGASVQTTLALVRGEWVKFVGRGEISHAVAARVIWVRKDECCHATFAGLELF
jgi:hypothetical protein